MFGRHVGGLDVLPGGALSDVGQGGINLGPNQAHLLGHIDQVIDIVEDATALLELFIDGFDFKCIHSYLFKFFLKFNSQRHLHKPELP